MEIIWKKGVGFKFSVTPRLALGLVGFVAATISAPDYLPGLLSILRAGSAGY